MDSICLQSHIDPELELSSRELLLHDSSDTVVVSNGAHNDIIRMQRSSMFSGSSTDIIQDSPQSMPPNSARLKDCNSTPDRSSWIFEKFVNFMTTLSGSINNG